MVKLGPDVESGTTDAYSGYLPSGKITGFSMMHESGTGGAPKYGVVSQMPVMGNVSNPLVDLGRNRSVIDESQLGCYKSSLDSGVTIEVAATEHAGLYNYTFPAGQKNVVVDVSHVLPSFRGLGWGQVTRAISLLTLGTYHQLYVNRHMQAGALKSCKMATTKARVFTTTGGTSLQTGPFTFVAISAQDH